MLNALLQKIYSERDTRQYDPVQVKSNKSRGVKEDFANTGTSRENLDQRSKDKVRTTHKTKAGEGKERITVDACYKTAKHGVDLVHQHVTFKKR